MTPLAGLHIAVTRPADQAEELAHGIARMGGKAFLFPLLEIAPAAAPQALRAVLSRLPEFDIAIFISPNAVRYGMEAIRAGAGVGRASARHVGLKPDLRIAAVGQGSARALRESGVHEVIAPQGKSDSEALLALQEFQDVRGKRVMIFRGDGGRELLGDTLKARGATVEYAECYRRITPQLDIARLRTASPDAITVTSSEALAHLWEACNETDRSWLAAIPLFVQHERIAEGARKLGWSSVTVTAGGDEGLLAGLVAWAQERSAA